MTVTTTATIRPCVYPRCDDGQGNARLTHDGMCRYCQRRYRRLLDWLVEDYVLLRTQMPRPSFGQRERVSGSSVEPGHPAEWASDTAAHIAAVLNDVEDGLRDYLRDSPPPHPGSSEPRRVAHAHKYLHPRIDRLATYPAASDTARELAALHGRVRGALGQTRHRTPVAGPCPECGLLTLWRTIEADRSDGIDCEHCGYASEGRFHGLYARLVAAELLHTVAAHAAVVEWLTRTPPVGNLHLWLAAYGPGNEQTTPDTADGQGA